jgi:hypothetical protein
MPPRAYTSIKAANRWIGDAGSRRRFGMLDVLAIAALLAIIVFRPGATSDSVNLETQTVARTCMQWHLAAGAVVSRLVQSTRDADLLLVSDSLFRMRRARRNCEAGWVTLACQDYHAVAVATPGYTLTNQLFPCSRIATTIGSNQR